MITWISPVTAYLFACSHTCHYTCKHTNTHYLPLNFDLIVQGGAKAVQAHSKITFYMHTCTHTYLNIHTDKMN